MLLIIDNYDSFTYNLVQHFGQLGESPLVKRNDEITLAEIEMLKPERICISPGPGPSGGRRGQLGVDSEIWPADACARRLPGASMHRCALRR